MAKGYWIARIDVHNMDGYKEYVTQNGAVFAKFGAKFLVRGGKFEAKEGSPRSRNVVLEFKDYETALACYNSPEYARLVAIRSPHAESDLVIIEGYDGAHPSVTRLILVCGPFGSGTTAVAGMLAGFGLSGIEPYFHSDDERTPNTFESIEFRKTMLRMVSEMKLTFHPGVDRQAEIARFRDTVATPGHATIFLKHPLSALLIPDICKALDTRLVYVLRPLADIEATRKRRNWKAPTGSAGARVIYGHMFTALIDHAFPTMILRYREVLADPLNTAKRLAQFAGLKVEADRIQQAAALIRRPASPTN